MSFISLFRQIIQHDPPIEVVIMNGFSGDRDKNENIGEVVLEALLTSSINSITTLDLAGNSSWFEHPGNIDLLTEVILKQAGL